MQICKITMGEPLVNALSLVEDVFMEFEAPDYGEVGVKTFVDFIRRDHMEEKIKKGDMRLWGAYDGGKLLGVIALREKQHISLLFVRKENHRQGVARKLFQMVKAVCEDSNLEKRAITVNASPYGVEAYKHLGFAKLEEEQRKDGIRFTPMICYLV